MVQRAQVALNALGFPEAELSILIVDDAFIAELNERFLHRSGPTNVIAFPMRTGDFTDMAPLLLGDVVISADTARREAAAARSALSRRMDELLIHGILHLCGYDHERSEREFAQMQAKSDELLKIVESI